ncbi:pyrroline-5-carboxylate reductase [Candidatus Formimonas warabiya]|uniref:Pyrroline-5-carboxylate reductase n=2 Tax=Formimonas warabiya TaxID=1761012 RepID=A0A3G1L142_FORW1|nr:pyrroline-5-carboxylate reductase [Candidatus Formimonas warabiya]
MAEAFISGLLKTDEYLPASLRASDTKEERLAYLREKYGIITVSDNEELVETSDVVILAVKPQNVREVLLHLKDKFTKGQLVISIVAGFSIDSLYQYIPKSVSVIRAMPNTPCLIRKGVSALAFSANITEEQKNLALNIMGSVGAVHILPEKLMNAVTGLSGSGPAYIFLVIEALCDAGVRAGLPREISLDLAVQTVMGAAAMVNSTKTHPAILKDKVITPAGTTIAALHVLERAGVRVAFMDAIMAAAERSQELGSEEGGKK